MLKYSILIEEKTVGEFGRMANVDEISNNNLKLVICRALELINQEKYLSL